MDDPGYWIEGGVLDHRECDDLSRSLDHDSIGRSRAALAT